MHLTRRIRLQLALFAVVSLVAATVMALGYIKLPAMFGIGRYDVTLQLARSGGLYPTGNVTYRGTQVGKIEAVELADDGSVRAKLSLQSGVPIPSNLVAEVHSQSAIGEQYVALLPRDDTSPPLTNGDVISEANTTVPPPIDTLLDDTNRGLEAIPRDDLRTVIDESYTAVGGLGPELSRLVKGSTNLAIESRATLESLKTIIDGTAPLLDSQTSTAGSIQAWASNIATVTAQLRDNNAAVAGLIDNGGPAIDEASQLVERLKPTLPLILSNLVTINRVALAYQPNIEQLLVLVPHGIALVQAGGLANSTNPNSQYKAGFLDFNLTFNVPPPCATGYLPPAQKRTPAQTDAPDRPEGDIYCRTPQDSPFNVRGAKNLPCVGKPWKRAPTVKICESDEEYVPLNDGFNWKGDPNATTTGQDIPQIFPSAGSVPTQTPSAPPPVAVVEYDPATGSYLGPDGQQYTQADLAQNAPKDKTWQQMLIPPVP